MRNNINRSDNKTTQNSKIIVEGENYTYEELKKIITNYKGLQVWSKSISIMLAMITSMQIYNAIRHHKQNTENANTIKTLYQNHNIDIRDAKSDTFNKMYEILKRKELSQEENQRIIEIQGEFVNN